MVSNCGNVDIIHKPMRGRKKIYIVGNIETRRKGSADSREISMKFRAYRGRKMDAKKLYQHIIMFFDVLPHYEIKNKENYRTR